MVLAVASYAKSARLDVRKSGSYDFAKRGRVDAADVVSLADACVACEKSMAGDVAFFRGNIVRREPSIKLLRICTIIRRTETNVHHWLTNDVRALSLADVVVALRTVSARAASFASSCATICSCSATCSWSTMPIEERPKAVTEDCHVNNFHATVESECGKLTQTRIASPASIHKARGSKGQLTFVVCLWKMLQKLRVDRVALLWRPVHR